MALCSRVGVLPPVLFAALVLGLAAAAPVRGQGKPNPCEADVKKFCATVQPGKGAVAACLRKHESELSAECQAARKEAQQAFKQRADAFAAACEEDTAKFCPGVKPGGGRIAACLKEHTAKLSSACAEQVSAVGRKQ